MAFALQLKNTLRHRRSQIVAELAAGQSLEAVLCKHLLAVESSASRQMLTSILLLDDEGRHLTHGAAPSLPKSYCDAIDGVEIGPSAGSCGTAAYLGQAVYVTDVATDPLWQDYRHIALEHGLRACWSTPIRSADGAMLGTFAIYHLEPSEPAAEEMKAIRLITNHVARAIEWSRELEGTKLTCVSPGQPDKTRLRLVSSTHPADLALGGRHAEQAFSAELETYARKFNRYAEMASSQELSDAFKTVARDCRDLLVVMGRTQTHDRKPS